MIGVSLECGCIPMVGGGVVRRCPAGAVLWTLYLDAIETHPGNQAAWMPHFIAYERHITGRGEGETWRR